MRANHRGARHRRNYARVRELFTQSTKRLAQLLVNNQLDEEEAAQHKPPTTGDVENLYQSLWGSESENVSYPSGWGNNKDQLCGVVCIPQIQLPMVKERHSRLKSGPYGKGNISCEILILLTIVFNLLLALN